MKFSLPPAELPGFQITPMLDVVFLLLCFFVTASVFSQWENEIDIQLPTADAAAAPDDRLPGEIIVNVDASGAIRVNERVLSPDELLRRCRLLAKQFPGHPIVVRGDKRTSYDNIMRVIDICRKADIYAIRFSTGDAPDDAPAP